MTEVKEATCGIAEGTIGKTLKINLGGHRGPYTVDGREPTDSSGITLCDFTGLFLTT